MGMVTSNPCTGCCPSTPAADSRFGLLVHSASRLQSDRNWPVCRVVPRFAWHNIGFRCLKHVLRQGYGGLGPAHSEWQSC